MLLNPIFPGAPFSTSWEVILFIVLYEMLVFLIEFICVTLTLRWRLNESLYGRTALAVLTANLASFFLVPNLGIALGMYYLVYLLLTFFIEYVIITGMFYGLNMLPEESQLNIMLTLIPVIFLSNLLTLFLGTFIPFPPLY